MALLSCKSMHLGGEAPAAKVGHIYSKKFSKCFIQTV